MPDEIGAKPVVFIHTNDRQMIPALVGAHALKARSRTPELFEVRFLRQEETPHLQKQHGQTYIRWDGEAPIRWRRTDAHSFYPLRRLVPELMGFTGRALVLDPDIFAVGDVWELLSRDMGGKAILCRQKAEERDGRRLYSSAVMLLDCAKLRHWQWAREIDDMFGHRRLLGPWISLLEEPAGSIGLFEEAWNDMDRLSADTKLLHLTEIPTQPWKTGLLADYYEYVPYDPPWLAALKHLARRVISGQGDRRVRYRPHPDPRQEALFFALLRECVDAGIVDARALRRAIRRKDLRTDAFEPLARGPTAGEAGLPTGYFPPTRRAVDGNAAE
jgi:hypothetical protein